MLKSPTGKYLTMSLFIELNQGVVTEPVFTLKKEDFVKDGITYLSARRLFVEAGDITGAKFADLHLADYDHWLALKSSPILKPYVDQWEKELEVRLRSQGIQAMRNLSNKGNVQAAKWLAEGSWKKKRGRPSKEEVQREKEIQAGIREELDEDFERISEETSH